MAETHFGYERVDEAAKSERVRGVFDSVAPNYDLMNDLMSLGLHRVWKAYTVAVANLRIGDKVLDVAGGTGDLARSFASRVGTGGLVVHSDINEAMLRQGRNRLIDAGVALPTVICDAETLPFDDASFEAVLSCVGVGPRRPRGGLGVRAGDPGPFQTVPGGELGPGHHLAVLRPRHQLGGVLGAGEQSERPGVEALLVGGGDEEVHPCPCLVDGRAGGVGGHPRLLRPPGRLRGRGPRGGQVVQRGLGVFPPGRQVGLQVVGPGVELGELRREPPHLLGPGIHLRAAAGQRTVAGIGRWWRRQRRTRSREERAGHEHGEQRGPSHQSPSGGPPGPGGGVRRSDRSGDYASARHGVRGGRPAPDRVTAPGVGRRLPSDGRPAAAARAVGGGLHPREGSRCPGRATRGRPASSAAHPQPHDHTPPEGCDSTTTCATAHAAAPIRVRAFRPRPSLDRLAVQAYC